MEISSKIKELVELALADRVLTFVERKTIVEAALKEGVAEEDINGFLDNALNERLQHYKKEDLKRCPHCGGQIPLISDLCLFCGKSLEINDTNPEPINISGEEAEIIRSENLRTSEENKNIKACPDCGAPFPLISNICPNCGHVLHEQSVSDLNIRNLIDNINDSTLKLKNTRTDFSLHLLYRLPELSLAYLILGCVFDFLYEFFVLTWGALIIIGLYILLFLYGVRGGISPAEITNLEFHKALYSESKYCRLLKTIYGNNKEATETLDKFDTEINIAKNKRHLISRSIIIATLLIIIVFAVTLVSC